MLVAVSGLRSTVHLEHRCSHDMIPTCICIDVEPDGVQIPHRGPAPWTGYATIVALMERLRTRLEEATGVTPRFAWFLRMDPQIGQSHGRADFAVDAFADRIGQLQGHGDVFGIHVHPLRWCDQRSLWFHDFADPAWLTHCVESSFEAYTGAFGSRPVLHRFGARFLSNEVVALLENLGTRADLTLEPGLSASTFPPRDAPMTGTLPDFRRVPRAPYRPARDDFRRADTRESRGLVMVPMSSTRRRPDKPLWWEMARMIRRGFRPKSLPLHPWRAWPSPQLYWDLVAQHLNSMRLPYLAFAVRTDAPGSESVARLREVMDLLPRHPLVRRLHFVDPLAVATNTTSR